jgi:subtilase family serine protease
VDGGVPFDGAWFLGAVVDEASVVAELIEFDNDRVGPLMGVGDGPDLVVAEIDAPPSAEHFAGFDVSVELCNHGTALAGPSELRLFLSADAQLEEMPPSPDPEIASFPVGEVSPGGCIDVLVPAFTDASLSGAALLFARADGFETVMELVESNNETAGPWMGIGSGPDFVVQSISAPASVHGGESFDVTVDLCNQGTQPGPPTAVMLYHSTDAVIEGSLPPYPGPDLYAGEIVSPDPLMPGACLALTGTGMADPAADGAYTFGAVVDEPDFVPELREENNAFAGPLMGIGDGPDLVVTQLDAPPSAFPDSWLPLDFEVCNQGTAPSGPSPVSFYDSKDVLIEFGAPPALPDGDRWLGEEPAPSLEPGACHTGSALVWLPSGELGERHLGAVADEMDAVPELVETNNVFVGPLLGIGTGPDLLVTRLAAPPSVQLFDPLSVDTQVCNQGTDWSGPAYLWLYLSSDPEIDGAYFDPPSGDPWLAEVSVPALAPGACHDEVAVGTPSVPSEGAWHLGGIVDEGMHVAELIESNNTTLGPLVGVGDGPDLVVVGLEVPPSAELGTSFPVSVDVCNQGTGANPMAYVTLFHSQDAEITSSFPHPPGPDVPFAFLDVHPLLAGECRNIAGTGSAGVTSWGAWFSGAIVDEEAFVPELVETNNSFVGPLMGLGTAPDLVIALLDAPAGLLIGASFPADIEVCNQGTDWSLPTMVSLYHSDDDVLDGPPPPIPTDTWLGDLAVPDLAPGACHLETKTVDPGVPGPGFLAAAADEGDALPELVEGNNAKLVELDVIGGP